MALKILHSNYHEKLRKHFEDVLTRCVEPFPDIEVTYAQEWDIRDLEQELDSYDVLLSHPGTGNQSYVMGDLPTKFPQLKIGIITLSPESYEESEGNVAVIGIKITDSLDKRVEVLREYVQSCAQGSNSS